MGARPRARASLASARRYGPRTDVGKNLRPILAAQTPRGLEKPPRLVGALRCAVPSPAQEFDEPQVPEPLKLLAARLPQAGFADVPQAFSAGKFTRRAAPLGRLAANPTVFVETPRWGVSRWALSP